MALILNIDTALETATASLAKDGKVLVFATNEQQQDHATWLHTAIEAMLQEQGLGITDLEAVGVSIGPGSYTGLRVGLSAAKGFCYALNVPLLAVSTLQLIAYASLDRVMDQLVCPMIDARRMEVFTAIYNKELTEIVGASAMVVDENSFHELLSNQKLMFCGNGSIKLQNILHHPNASFSANPVAARHLADLTHREFELRTFANLAYIEPLYVKEFYSTMRKPLI